MKDHLGTKAAAIFSLYIWISLLYVIVVFTDLTSSAFVSRPQLGAENFGPGVATSSLFYLGLAFLMGLALTKLKWNLKIATLIFIPAIFVVIALGQYMPLIFEGDALLQQKKWNIVILLYCFLASVIPLWMLLQPRGYLGGFILYSTFIVGIVGIIFGHVRMEYPMIKAAFAPNGSPIPLFPLLFTTVACGACSGFHGLVASGTTSKQLAKESDARLVGYGSMLLESLLAVIAMATLIMLPLGSPLLDLGPDEIYARGLAHFMKIFGIPFAAGVTFGKLAFATFIYDTLDVTTRLGRYVFEELSGIKGKAGALLGTVATLAIPALCIFSTFHDASGNAVPLWKIVWPAFGASNQLLAALTLMGITVWQRKEGRNWLITGLPAVFMTLISFFSLANLISKRMINPSHYSDPVGIAAVLLLVLASIYIFSVGRRFRRLVTS